MGFLALRSTWGSAHSAGFFLLRGTAHSTAPRGFVFPPSLKPPSLWFLNAFFFALSSRSVTFFASPQGRGLSVRTSHTSPYPLSSKKMRQTSLRDQGKRKKLQRSSLHGIVPLFYNAFYVKYHIRSMFDIKWLHYKTAIYAIRGKTQSPGGIALLSLFFPPKSFFLPSCPRGFTRSTDVLAHAGVSK